RACQSSSLHAPPPRTSWGAAWLAESPSGEVHTLDRRGSVAARRAVSYVSPGMYRRRSTGRWSWRVTRGRAGLRVLASFGRLLRTSRRHQVKLTQLHRSLKEVFDMTGFNRPTSALHGWPRSQARGASEVRRSPKFRPVLETLESIELLSAFYEHAMTNHRAAG